MKRSGVKAMTAALRNLAHGAWVAFFIALLFSASPGAAQAATCAIDFNVAYNATNVSHVMSMASNLDEFSTCDPRKVANPGDPLSGFTPAGQAGASANGGSFSTQAGASDDTISYTAPTGFSGVDTFVVYFCDDSSCSLAGRRTANVSVTVDPPTITIGPSSLGTITQDEVYQRTLTATGGTGPYSFAVTAGTLPPGLQVGSIFLNGRPTASGFFTFTLTATDSSTGAGAPYTGSRSYTVLVNTPQPPSILPVLRFVPHNSVNHPIQLDFSGSVFVGGILIPGGGGSPTAVTTPTLPSHGTVSINGTFITYTPTPGYAGSDSFTYRASNSGGTSNTATVTIAVETPTITVDPISLSDGATGVAYSQTVAATGGSGPYTYVITAGAQPAGLVLNAAGELSGTPTGVGPYSFTVTATDTGGNGPHTPFTGAQAYTVTIATPTQAIANPSSATVAYNSANNPIALTITGGGPTGVTVSTQATNGTAAAAGTSITYTPTASYSGPDSFAYTATNADGTSAPATVTITVNPQAPIAGAVTATVAQDSGGTPIALNITGGTPTSVNASAVVNGSLIIVGASISFTPTPGYSGPASFNYTATNAGGTSAPATVTITVSPQPPVAAAVSATVAYNSSNNPITLNLAGGPPTSLATPGLPSHGAVSIAGTAITYTPTAGYAGLDSFTYTATNASGTSAPATVTVTVSAPAAPTAAAVSVAVAANSSNNAIPLNLGGGTPASVATPGLPTHGTVSIAGTAIIYTPAAGYSGADSFTYTATNPGGSSAPATVTITVSPPTLTLSALPTTGQVADPFNTAIVASLGAAPYSYAVTAGALPTGLALSSGGVLSGMATAPGTFNFTVTATDAHGAAGAQAYAITIGAPTLAITSPAPGALPPAEAWAAYSQTFTSTGGVGPRTFALTAGALPPGVGLTSGGVLSGVPTTPGAFNFSLTVSDSSGAPGPFVSAPVSYSLTVTAPTIALTPAAGALSAAATAQAYSQIFTANGGVGPYGYALSAGALPPGLSLTSTGVLSGAPTASGTYNFSVTAQDSHGFDASNAYSITVADPVVAVTSPAAGALPLAEAWAAYSQTFTATGGIGPRSFGLSAGTLPPGMSLISGGLLSGAPTTPGTFNFSIVASDSSSAPGPFTSAPAAYSLTVAAPTISFTPATLPDGMTGQAYAQALTASGGTAPYTYALTAGALPPGIALAASGSLSGTPTAVGAHGFTIRVTDAHGFSADNVYSLLIIDAAPVAVADAASTPANQAVDIPVIANDIGVITSTAVAGAPAHGTAVVNGLAIAYTPGPDYFGAASFTYTATGPGGTSAPTTVTVTVTPLAVPTAAAKVLAVPTGQSGRVNATAGSTGGPITGVAVVTAPTNGTAVVVGQDLVYTPGAGYAGADSFTYTLTNPFGISAPATVTVTVNPAPVTAADITIEILAGQTASVNLTADAAGGPFTSAAVVSLTPATAGLAAITNPAAGQYGLTFTPAADFAGTVTATYTLSNAFATSTAGRVTVIVTARPDPGVDPEVTGLISAQGESASRFATTQISNVNSRLESLRDGGGGGTSLRLNFAGGSRALADDHDPLRRRLEDDDNRTDVLPGMSYGGDPMNSMGGEPVAAAGGSTQGRFGLWVAGGIDFGQRDGTAGQSGVEFDTDGLTAGADMRISEQFVLGGSVGWAHDESRIGEDGTRSNADGRSYAVYGSYQPGPRFFVDGIVGHGTLDFDSRRHIAASGEFAYGQRDGSQSFGALTGGWDMRDGDRLLSPYGRISATRSELGAFAETTGGAYALAYESQTVRTLTGTLGVRSAWSWPTSYGEVTPRLRFEYSHDFQGAERANLFYVDWIGGPVYGVEVDPLDQNRVLGGFGLDMLARGGARFSFDYEIGIASGAEQHRLQLEIQTRF